MSFVSHLAKIDEKIGNVALVLNESKHKLRHILRHSSTSLM